MKADEPDPGSALELLIQSIRDVSIWPGAGAGAAVVVALAAGLIEAAARRSDGTWGEAGGTIAQAAALRRRALGLARENAAAHLAAQAALGSASAERAARDQEIADIQLGDALALAADLPLAIAEAAVDAAELGAAAAESVPDEVRADAAGAAELATASVVVAAHLVEVNLATRAGDPRLEHVDGLVEAARAASDRALATGA